MSDDRRFTRVLCLDGGGAKGLYTLGVLREVEHLLRIPLWQHFDFIYGTSTGAIIASSLAFGNSVQDTLDEYRKNVPRVMRSWTARGRAAALRDALRDTYGAAKFDAFKTGVGIVATNYDTRQPFIFKTSVGAAHGLKASFVAGFGCEIAEAVAASCSAFPFFPPTKIAPANQAPADVIDGGFVANDPSLLAFIDMRKATKPELVRILSVGVGAYPERLPLRATWQLLRYGPASTFIQRQFEISSNVVQVLSGLAIPAESRLRVNEVFREPEYGTSLFEADPNKLEKLVGLGRASFGRSEEAIVSFLRDSTSDAVAGQHERRVS